MMVRWTSVSRITTFEENTTGVDGVVPLPDDGQMDFGE